MSPEFPAALRPSAEHVVTHASARRQLPETAIPASSYPRGLSGLRRGLVVVLLVVVQGAWPGSANAEAGPFQVYTVQPGDTLSEIATNVGMTTDGLKELNGLAEPDRLVVGTVLVIVGGGAEAVTLSRSAAPATESAAADAPATETYRVQGDDTLSAIAERFDTDVATLARMNALANEHQLSVGLALDVPRVTAPAPPPAPLQEHVVQAGETVTEIAARFGIADAALASANELRDPNRIRVGSVLVIPARVLPLPSPQVAEAVREVALELGLDPYLLLALSYLESGWQMDVVSSTGAVGMMQLMPETAVWASRDLLGRTVRWQNSLRDNTHLGSAYLRHLLVLAHGDVATALAAYYQGWTSVKTEGRFEETEQYVDDVLALVDRFRARIPVGQ